jgi:hypothetical protein
MLAVVHARAVYGVAIWKVLTLQCILVMSQTPISRRNLTCLDAKHAGRSFCSALGLSSESTAKKQVT